MNREQLVMDPTGASGRITGVHHGEVQVELEHGATISLPRRLLKAKGNGYALAKPFGEAARTDTEATAVPVVEEVLKVEKRKTTKGVRITKQVTEREEEIEIPTSHQEVTVARVPLDRVVDGPLSARVEGDTTIISVMEEEVFVQKRWILREEIRITKTEVSGRERNRVALKKESVRIEPRGE